MNNDCHPDRSRRDDQLDHLTAGYIERMNEGEILDPDKIELEHPEFATELLERLRAFQRVGVQKPDHALGTLGDYTLRRQIGRGGMGVVYEAWQRSLDRRVALKVLPVGLAADTKATSRFLREAQVAARLSHPQVVSVYGFGVEQNSPYYAMEFVEGETLAQLLARIKDADDDTETPFGPKNRQDFYIRLAALFADVADGLQHAHSKGVTHRDIKPSNLILDQSGRLRILDFGLAHLEGQESLTMSGDFVGTPLYMSPEQARRKKIPVDHRTDVYSLGATMYEAICGRPPFRGKDHADTLTQIVERDPVEPRKVNPRAPKDLETIVLKCLRKDAGDRYGTAEALGQDVRRLVRGDAIEAKARSCLETWARRIRIHYRRVVAALLVAFLLALVAFLGLEQLETSRRAVRDRYEAGTRRAAMVANLARITGGDRIGPLRAVPFFEPDDLASISSAEAYPVEATVEELERVEALEPSRFEAPYQQARLLHLLGRDDEARAALERSLSSRPGFVPAAFLLAQIAGTERTFSGSAAGGWRRNWVAAREAYLEKRFDDMARSYDALLRVEARDGEELYLGSSIEIQLGRGLALLEAGDPFGAVIDFAAAAERWPDFCEPSLLLAFACYESERPEHAQVVFERLYERSASRDEAAYWIVATSRILGDYTGALRWADKIERTALREQVKSALLLFSYRFADAERAARHAIDAAPDDALGHALLSISLTYREQQGGEEAGEPLRRDSLAEARRACALRPEGAVARAILAYALQETGQPEAADRALEEAIALGPKEFLPRFLAGQTTMARYDDAQAERHYREAVRIAHAAGLAHEEALARALTAEVLHPQGYDRAALEECRAALAIFSENRAQRCLGDLLSWWLGEHDLAEESYERAVESCPYDGPTWSRLAEVRLKLGKITEAREAIDRALRLAPQHVEAVAVRGWVDFAAGDPSAALGAELDAVRLRPHSDFANRNLASALLRQPTPGGDPRVDPLASAAVDRLFSHLKGRRDSARALLLLHARAGRDLDRAHELAKRGVESLEGPMAPYDGDGDFAYRVAALAFVEHARGEKGQAVRTLERALSDPHAPVRLEDTLERWRGELTGQLVSYATLEARGPDALRAAAALPVADTRLPADAEREARIALFARALTHEQAGRAADAESAYRALTERDSDPTSARPRLGVGRALVLQNKASEAEAYLRRWLLSAGVRERAPWEAWSTLCFKDLSLEPAEILARLERGRPAAGDEATSDEPRYLADLRWSLDRLGGGVDGDRALRILAGSTSDASCDGVPWSRDRFFVGGKRVRGPGSRRPDVEIKDPRYARVRRFGRDELSEPTQTGGSYRIPLPPGHYRVTLWLSALDCSSGAGVRRLSIEAQPPERCETVALDVDVARACRQSADVDVLDGILEVEFLDGAHALNVAALQVDPIDSPGGAPGR